MRDADYQALADYLDGVHVRLQASLGLIAWQPPGDGPGARALHGAIADVLTDVVMVRRRLRVMDDIGRAMDDGLRPAWQRAYLISDLTATMPGAWAGGRDALGEAREYVRKLQRQRQRQRQQQQQQQQQQQGASHGG